MKFLRFFVEKPSSLRDFLKEKLEFSGRVIKKIVDRGWVFVNEERILKANFQLRIGDKIEVIFLELDSSYKVLYEDDYILAVDKPPFVLTNESPWSLEAILNRNGKRVRAIHRLDLETTGVLLFAKDDNIFGVFKELFRKRLLNKVYKVIAEGSIRESSFKVSLPVDGKEAISLFRVIERSKIATFLEVRILTGRKHQIRIHLSKIGHPVVGEKLYKRGIIREEVLRKIPRIMIHCEEISFEHPFLGKFVSIFSSLPGDFKEALKALF
ncbi:MAG: RluA family pseudouridine synthase [Synergistetes bacterium]|nr:RluA family pseudouridine synthase [Synergistota bacterium]MCX8127379.1 RluA family pseudouridine synthase [Synergistota bacterium]MDW8192243.1 RluA family pseudouridine synthase [Synergistota bacterium]